MQRPKFVSRISANALAFASVSASSLFLVVHQRWEQIRELGLSNSSYLPFIFLAIGVMVFLRYRSWMGLIVGAIVIWELHLAAYLAMMSEQFSWPGLLHSLVMGQYYYSIVLLIWLAAISLARMFISSLLETEES